MKTKLMSIDEYQESVHRNWYGSKYKVYRSCDVVKIRQIRSDWHSLLKYHTMTQLIDYAEHRRVDAMRMHNNFLERMKEKYPNIKEFQNWKIITKI